MLLLSGNLEHGWCADGHGLCQCWGLCLRGLTGPTQAGQGPCTPSVVSPCLLPLLCAIPGGKGARQEPKG